MTHDKDTADAPERIRATVRPAQAGWWHSITHKEGCKEFSAVYIRSDLVEAAVLKERERCAKIAEKHLPLIPHDGPSDEYTHGYYMACGYIAAAIREDPQ